MTNIVRPSVLKKQWATLEKLRGVSSISDYEYEKRCILEVLESVEEARVQFEVGASTHVRFSSSEIRHKSWLSASERSSPCMRLRQA